MNDAEKQILRNQLALMRATTTTKPTVAKALTEREKETEDLLRRDPSSERHKAHN